jgi:hypothetical protein
MIGKSLCRKIKKKKQEARRGRKLNTGIALYHTRIKYRKCQKAFLIPTKERCLSPPSR